MKRKIIALNNTNTFPTEIEKLVAGAQPWLEHYFANQKICFDLDVRCALECYFVYTDSNLMELQKRVLEVLEPTFFEGFHNTRVLHKEEIEQFGLQILETHSYFSRLRSALTTLRVNVDDQNIAFEHLSEYLNNKHGNRSGMLSFFTPFNLCQDYWQFTRCIGGEICEFGLSQNFPEVYKVLATNGYSVTVKFILPFCNIGISRKDVIAFEFIRHYAAKQLLNYNYNLAFDAYVTQPVPPSDILDIIDFVDEYQCE